MKLFDSEDLPKSREELKVRLMLGEKDCPTAAAAAAAALASSSVSQSVRLGSAQSLKGVNSGSSVVVVVGGENGKEGRRWAGRGLV